MENTHSDNRIAVLAIIVEDLGSVTAINQLLHDYEALVQGRLGLPFRNRGVNIISVLLDGPQDRINSLAGSLGRLSGVTAKAVYGKK